MMTNISFNQFFILPSTFLLFHLPRPPSMMMCIHHQINQIGEVPNQCIYPSSKQCPLEKFLKTMDIPILDGCINQWEGDNQIQSSSSLDKGIKFLIYPNSQLQMPWCDPLHLQIFTCICNQFKNFHSQILQNWCQISCSRCSHTSVNLRLSFVVDHMFNLLFRWFLNSNVVLIIKN